MSQSIEFIHRHSSALERIASGLTLQQNTVNSDGKIFCKKDAANIVFSEDEQRVVAEARKAAKEQQIELKSEPKPEFTLNLAIEASKVCRIVRLPKNCVAMAEATVRSLIRWTYGTSDPITKDFLLEYLKSANHPDPAVFLCQEKVVGCYTKNYPQALELVGREAMIEEGVASIKEGRVLLMHGLSGNGKTQLAIHCVAEASEDADAIIWEVGDNSLQPLTLARLLDSMADKLHKSELKDIPKESEKVTKICRFLKDSGIKVYLVIDNFNAIPQQNMRSVINFISDNFSKLPDCRTIITTQANPNTQIQRCINMSIPGLSEDQGVKLMLSRLGDVAINEDSLRAISHATGGNPQVLLTAVQMLKEFDTTEEILLSLQDCADKNGWFTAFYKTVWEHLSSEVKQIVLATSLFPKSVSIKALEQVTGLEDFKSHLIHAYDYCLVERYKFQVEDGIEEQRISQHELVRRVAERELNRPENAEMVAELHQRWSEWAIEFSAPFERDVVWNDHSFLQKLDDHEFSDLISLQRFLDWSEEQGDRNTFLKVSGNLRFFYYTRGFWAAEKEMSLKRVRVAKDLGYQNMALDSLLYHINVACKQGNKAEIEKHISEMLRLYNECCKTGLSWIEMVEYNHVCALIAQVQKSQNWKEKCLDLWEDTQALIEDHFGEISGNTQIWNSFNFHNNVNLRYLAKHYLVLQNWEKARSMLEKALTDSQEKGFQRGQVFVLLNLADLHIQQEQFDEALEILDDLTLDVWMMREKLALGQLNMLRGDALFGVGKFQPALLSYRDALCHFRDLEHKASLKSVEDKIYQTKGRIKELSHA